MYFFRRIHFNYDKIRSLDGELKTFIFLLEQQWLENGVGCVCVTDGPV